MYRRTLRGLAYACSTGCDDALKAFTQECEGELRAVAQKLKIFGDELDDVRQIVWDKVFLESPEHSKRILEYRGAGRLLHWFRVLAARTMLDELRKARRSDKQQLLARQRAMEHSPKCRSRVCKHAEQIQGFVPSRVRKCRAFLGTGGATQLSADSGELDSMMRLFDEEMSVSLSRLLR